MPCYYFDAHDGRTFIEDLVGTELDSLEAAEERALQALPDMAREEAPERGHRTMVVKVRDEAGRTVLRVGLTLIVEPAHVGDQAPSTHPAKET